MRGGFVDQGRLFSYVSPEARVPANHPLRTIRAFVRDVPIEASGLILRGREHFALALGRFAPASFYLLVHGSESNAG
jgi:hypothetical protein